MSPGNRGEQNVLNFETVKPDLKKKKKSYISAIFPDDPRKQR